ncbi:uncharacterized protein N7511_006828 [Penicillium nucicola]|uniref:uncharacterized protein n=1 Tax=Penicillium nucicola TaxID=1850975 RepID=UPI00254523BA|nr:uncharacterized protein N7511_006828 [Penicillium nucicola]KAJ5758134.1 hypothetical protein N7511_006828 [Penicillium nucicola]
MEVFTDAELDYPCNSCGIMIGNHDEKQEYCRGEIIRIASPSHPAWEGLIFDTPTPSPSPPVELFMALGIPWNPFTSASRSPPEAEIKPDLKTTGAKNISQSSMSQNLRPDTEMIRRIPSSNPVARPKRQRFLGDLSIKIIPSNSSSTPTVPA